MIERAVRKQFGTCEMKVASVEDLILLKAVSLRQKDQHDVITLWRRFRGSVDRRYLESRLHELSEALDRNDLLELLKTS